MRTLHLGMCVVAGVAIWHAEARGGDPASIPDKITAKTFSLVDAQGRERAQLSTLPEGAVQLVLSDRLGRIRAMLSGGAGTLDQAQIILADGLGRHRLHAKVDNGGSTNLNVYGGAGVTEAANTEIPRLELTASTDGMVYCAAFQPFDSPRAILGLSPRKGPSLRLLGPDGTPLAGLPK